MSAPVTEAHQNLAGAVWSSVEYHKTPHAAQIIADSEAKATEQANAQVESLISSAKNAIPASEHPAEPTVENWAWQIRNLGDDRRLVYAERDQLRAEVAWWKNWHDENEKMEDGIAVKVQATIAQLRAEVDAQCLLNAKGSEREAVLLGRVDRMAKECLNLRADLDAIKAIRDEETARAERAEALLGQLQELHGCSQEMVVHWCARAAERSLGLGEAQAELAAERARLDWLLLDVVSRFDDAYYNRAAIDAAIKEDTK